MGLLVLGLAIFFAVHIVPSFRLTRGVLIARFGEATYKGVFSLLALLGFVLIVLGKANSDSIALWRPPEWGHSLALWVMPLALILLVGSFIPSNLKRLTAHPMLWGVLLWALLHLLANGDVASVMLFGSFGAYSLYAMWAQTQRGARTTETARSMFRDIAVVIAGLVAYGFLLYGHRWLFGVGIV